MEHNGQKKVCRIQTKFPDISGRIPPRFEEINQLRLWMEDLHENGIKPHAHIRLFMKEFLEHIRTQESQLLINKFAFQFSATLFKWKDEAEDKNKALFLSLAAEETEKSMLRDLFKHLTAPNKQPQDPEAIYYVLVIIARCKQSNPSAFEELHLNGLENIEYYARLYAGQDLYKVDRIRCVLEPEHIIAWFKTINAVEYEPLLDRIRVLYDPNKPGKREIEEAACLLIRGLVHCTDGLKSTRELGNWYYDFLEALKSHGDCRMIPRLIDPDWQEDLDRWNARKIVGNANDLDIGDLNLIDEEDDKSVTYSRDQRQFLQYRKENGNGKDDYEPDPYTLRPYQNELIKQAKGGTNTIICAPTGSGKTMLAVDIIKTHLQNRHRDGKVGRALMLVPTVPLVDQQATHFVQYLTNCRDQYQPDIPYWVDGFSGCENDNDGRANRILTADICVMTPQILINMMNSVLRSERVYFADFSLIIFDECHHCDKGHPYKMLMEMLEKKLQEKLLIERPQIVGLTASMGVGDSGWDMRTCQRHMLKLCSHLMADSISTVRNQLDNLCSYVMPPVDDVQRVRRPEDNRFIEEINHVMSTIEQEIQPKLRQVIENDGLNLNKEDIIFPTHDSHSRYQTMVGKLRKEVQRVQDPDTRFQLVRSLDHLAHYFHAILISDLLPNHYGLEYLKSKMANYDTMTNSTATNDTKAIEQINQHLQKKYQSLRLKLDKYAQNEKVKDKEILCKLHEILRDQFQRDPESRCLIFVATRNCAQKLSHYLENEPELPMFYRKKNVGFMVSSNQSGSASGQSSQDQQNMRHDFDSGRIKLLVVTSVAEEGVNIAACNLIIKYNNVGSERSMIQRRGRARQKNSRSILLALDTNIEQAEYTNIRKEAMMKACIQNLQETDEMTLKKLIKEKREELEEIRKNDERRLADKRQQLSGRRYNINCRSCCNLICTSPYIRTVADSLFVVCDDTVWKRSKIDVKNKPTKDQLYTKCARWLCGKCGTQEWGTVVKYSNCYLPQLVAGNFTLDRADKRNEYETAQTDGHGEGSRCTWNMIQNQFFNIDPINLRNIRQMYSALLQAMPSLITQMNEQEYIANFNFIEKMKEKKNQRKDKIKIFLEE